MKEPRAYFLLDPYADRKASSGSHYDVHEVKKI